MIKKKTITNKEAITVAVAAEILKETISGASTVHYFILTKQLNKHKVEGLQEILLDRSEVKEFARQRKNSKKVKKTKAKK